MLLRYNTEQLYSFANLRCKITEPTVSVAIGALGARLCSGTADSSSFNGQKTKRKEISNLYSAHRGYEGKRKGTNGQPTDEGRTTDGRKDMGKASADFVTLTSNLTTAAAAVAAAAAAIVAAPSFYARARARPSPTWMEKEGKRERGAAF